MFWGGIQSDWPKMLVKCLSKLNAAGYLENLKNYEKEMYLLGHYFSRR